MLADTVASARQAGRTVAGNFAALVLGEAASRGFTFLASLYLARRLGVERFGAVEVALAMVVYVQLLVEGGLDTVATRAVARQPVDRSRYADNLAGLRLALVTFAIAIVGLSTVVTHLPPLPRTLLVGFSLAVLPAAFSLNWSFQAAARMRAVAVAGALTQAAYLALLVWLVHDAADVGAVPWAYGLSALFGMAVLMLWHRRRFGQTRPRADLRFWRATVADALPILGARVLRAVSFNFDVLLLGAISTTTAVAYYAAAYRFVLIPVAGFATFFSALFPALVTASDEQRTRLARVLLVGVGVTSLAAAVVLVVIAGPLITFAMGPAYAPAAGTLRWLAWSIPLIAVAGVFRQVLIARRLQRIDLAAVAIGAMLNVVLNLLLVPGFGVTGAAIATLAGEAAVLGAAIVGLRLVAAPPTAEADGAEGGAGLGIPGIPGVPGLVDEPLPGDLAVRQPGVGA